MSITRTENVLARLSRDAGTTDSDVVAVPAAARWVTLVIDRGGWPVKPGKGLDREVLRAQIHYSPDGGRTWRFLVGCGAVGGEPEPGDEEPIWIRTELPGARGRRVRVRLNTRLTLTCSCHLDFED